MVTLHVSSLSAAARREIGTLVATLGDGPSAEFATPTALTDALATDRRATSRSRSDPLVITGLDWSDAEPFIAAAGPFAAPAVMLVRGPVAESHPAREAGAAAVLQATISPARLRAALEAVRAQLRVFDTHTDPPAPRPLADSGPRSRGLTPREHEVLGLLASGGSNKRIARTLGVSPNTVKFHLAALFEKLAVTSRAEAVAVALRRGTLTL